MKKNVAGQHAPSMTVVNASDGNAITVGVVVYVTVDDGTQTAGAGTATHKGKGEWSYAPTQAETNGDKLAFKFFHANAVGGGPTATVYTTYPQTGDAYGVLNSGAHGNAALKALIDALDARATEARLAKLDGTIASPTDVTNAQNAITTAVGDPLQFGEYTAPDNSSALAAKTAAEAVRTKFDAMTTTDPVSGGPQFTTEAMENAPSGGGGEGSFTADDRTKLEANYDVLQRVGTGEAAILAGGGIPQGGPIRFIRGDSFSTTVTTPVSIADATNIWLTIKADRSKSDASSVLQWTLADGLVWVQSTPAGGTFTGTLTVVDDTNFTVTLSAAAAALLRPVSNLVYDIQKITADGTVTTIAEGTAQILADITRATA